MISESHVVYDHTMTVQASRTITKERPDQVVDLDWPPAVWHGIEVLGWKVETSSKSFDVDQYGLPVKVPNWAQVAGGLEKALDSLLQFCGIDPEEQVEDPLDEGYQAVREQSVAARVALDTYRAARMEAAMVPHKHDLADDQSPTSSCHTCGIRRSELGS